MDTETMDKITTFFKRYFVQRRDVSRGFERTTRKEFIEHLYATYSAMKIRPSSPIIVGWGLTRYCNLLCKHCSADAGPSYPASPRELAVELEQVRQVSESGALLAVLTGGEPLLHPHWRKIVSHAKELGLSVAILTNAYSIIFDDLQFLSEVLTFEQDHVQVSLDGSTATIYAAQRGVDAFNRVIENIKNLVAKGIYTTVNVTATRLNVHDIENIYVLARGLGVQECNINPASPKGRAKNSITPEPTDYLARIISLYSELSPNESTRLTFSLPVELFPLVYGFVDGEGSGSDSDLVVYLTEENCSMSITGSGMLTPGTELGNDFAFGNIKDVSISKAWTSAAPLIRDLRNTKCSLCKLAKYCQGGKPEISYDHYGTIHMPDPRCTLRF